MKSVSVIIPVYNMEKRIVFCLESLLVQQYKNLEIVIVDDGSTDNTYSVCRTYANKDNRIKLLSKPNSGVADATNLGLDQASGDYILFVDSDDYIEKNAIQIMVSSIEESCADIVQGSARIENENGEVIIIERSPAKIINGTNNILEDHLVFNIIGGNLAQKLFKASLFDDIRLPAGRNLADFTTMLYLLRKCAIYKIIPEICYIAVKRSSSISLSSINDRTYADILYYINCLDDIKKDHESIEWCISYAKIKMLMQCYHRTKLSNDITNKTVKQQKLIKLFHAQYFIMNQTNVGKKLSMQKKWKIKLFNYCPNIYSWLASFIWKH